MNIESKTGIKVTETDADRWLEKLDPFDRAAFEFSVTQDERIRADRIQAGKVSKSQASPQVKPDAVEANTARFAQEVEGALQTEVVETLSHAASKRPLEPAGGAQMDLEPELGTS